MAVISTSGLYGFTQAASSLVAGALRLCSAIGDEEIPTSAQAQNTMQSLNAMVKGWQASGLHLWAELDATLFVDVGIPQYTIGPNGTGHACFTTAYLQTVLTTAASIGDTALAVASNAGMTVGDPIGVALDAEAYFWSTIDSLVGSTGIVMVDQLTGPAATDQMVFSYAAAAAIQRPLRVMAGRRFNWLSRIDTPMIPLSRIDYANMPNKFNTGTLSQFFYDPGLNDGYGGGLLQSYGTMNVWPSPNSIDFGMRFTAQRPLQDFDTLANVPDFPQEWLPALRWNLALEIAPEFDCPAERITVLAKQAERWYTMASQWDREPESYLFGVARQPGYRSP